jgi:hypothetical protein
MKALKSLLRAAAIVALFALAMPHLAHAQVKQFTVNVDPNTGTTASVNTDTGLTVHCANCYSGALPFGATPISASNTGAAAAAVSATLPAVAGKTTYLTGFCVTSTNPAAAENGLVAVTGTISTLDFEFVEGVSLGGQLCPPLPKPIPASAADTPIVVTLPAITSGGAGAVTAYGFQL